MLLNETLENAHPQSWLQLVIQWPLHHQQLQKKKKAFYKKILQLSDTFHNIRIVYYYYTVISDDYNVNITIYQAHILAKLFMQVTELPAIE